MQFKILFSRNISLILKYLYLLWLRKKFFGKRDGACVNVFEAKSKNERNKTNKRVNTALKFGMADALKRSYVELRKNRWRDRAPKIAVSRRNFFPFLISRQIRQLIETKRG